ncbi:MAG: twin-arginine translocase subunit TatC [Elusimicrobia bacterium]|nr:twin-arginine translocase subunit TatC [Elusimicrobiota bacterium]
MDDPAEPLTAHLVELRLRLIYSLLFWAAGMALCYSSSGRLLGWLARRAGGVVFTMPAEAFTVRLKAAAFLGFLAALPLIFHQVWLFVARALSPSLRRLASALAAASYLLFALGAALALFVVVPAAMRFLLAFGSEDIRPLMTLSGYLGFVTSLALAFGGVFQVPIGLVVLNRLGLVSRRALRERWRFVYLGAFVLAAVLTPGPDLVSQLALAVPCVAIFELTMLVLR